MRGFSSRTAKSSSARAPRAHTIKAAAAMRKGGAARRSWRGAAPRIRSNLGAAHSQLNRGDDQDHSYCNAYPCLRTGKESTGVDQMPYAGGGSACGIIHKTAFMRPHILRVVERHERQSHQSSGDQMTDHTRPKKDPLEYVQKQRG